MSKLVVYDSWTGNTKRIAQAIAKGLGSDVVEVHDAPIPTAELLVIGTPVHFGPTLAVQQYLEKVNPTVMALFATYGAPGKFGEYTVDKTFDTMNKKNLPLLGTLRLKGFHPFLMTYPTKPDEKSIKLAEDFGSAINERWRRLQPGS